MTQYYVPPAAVELPAEYAERAWSVRTVMRYLERDGQIVPLLVHRYVEGDDIRFVVANDFNQAERLFALKMLDWPTILVEDEWGDDDL